MNKYTDKHPENMQIKIADFGLSRDFASTYMTGTLGTYVSISLFFSIGWRHKFSTTNPIV